MTAGAQARGVQGIIVNGRVRDLSEHREAGFPVCFMDSALVMRRLNCFWLDRYSQEGIA